MAEPTVAVIVPTFRRPALLERCLDGLAAQTRMPERVVVVRREGDEPTREVLARLLPALVPVLPLEVAVVSAPGQIAAIAAGLDRCTEDVVAHTDDDAVPRPDWVARLLSHYSPDVGGVGGRDVLPHGGLPAPRRVGQLAWFGRLHGNHHAGRGDARDADVLKGANISLRRELWRLDTALRGEGAQIHMEVGLCLAARGLGWRLVYDPGAIVDHTPASRFDEDDRHAPTLRAQANVEFNYAYVLARHLPAWRLAAAVAYVLGVGTRTSPGVVAWLEAVLRRPAQAFAATRLLVALTGARLRGLGHGIGRRLAA